jgi:hypothetical protein
MHSPYPGSSCCRSSERRSLGVSPGGSRFILSRLVRAFHVTLYDDAFSPYARVRIALYEKDVAFERVRALHGDDG